MFGFIPGQKLLPALFNFMIHVLIFVMRHLQKSIGKSSERMHTKSTFESVSFSISVMRGTSDLIEKGGDGSLSI